MKSYQQSISVFFLQLVLLFENPLPLLDNRLQILTTILSKWISSCAIWNPSNYNVFAFKRVIFKMLMEILNMKPRGC